MKHRSDAVHLGGFPSATGILTRLACRRAKEKGFDVEALLRDAGLTSQQIADPDARVDVKGQIRFLNHAAKKLNDSLLGFQLAQQCELRALGLYYYVLASSDVLDEALRRGARYSSMVNEGIALNYRGGKSVTINVNYVGIARHSDRHQIEATMVTIVRMCRELTSRRLPVSQISFTHRRSDDISEFKAFFGGEVTFGAALDEVVFPASIREMPIVGADPYLNQLLIRYCEEALAARSTTRSPYGSRVENAIAVLMPHGKAQAREVSGKLGVSQRTLARRLSSEGLTFAGIMRSLKADLANRHLADKTLSVSQIAWLLGYQDVSAFTHAFKRWTGTTPRALRQALR